MFLYLCIFIYLFWSFLKYVSIFLNKQAFPVSFSVIIIGHHTLLHSVIGSKFQPIRSETKTNRGSRVHIFPRFVSATCNYCEFGLVSWIVFLIGQSNYFGFGFTTLDLNSVQHWKYINLICF